MTKKGDSIKFQIQVAQKVCFPKRLCGPCANKTAYVHWHPSFCVMERRRIQVVDDIESSDNDVSQEEEEDLRFFHDDEDQ